MPRVKHAGAATHVFASGTIFTTKVYLSLLYRGKMLVALLLGGVLILAGCKPRLSPSPTPALLPTITPAPTQPAPTLPPPPTSTPTATPLPQPLNLTPASAAPHISAVDSISLAVSEGYEKPGSVTVMWEAEPLLWTNGWCAKDAATLQENLQHISFRFQVNGKDAPLDFFGSETYRDESLQADCVNYAAVLEAWLPGTHRLVSDISINAAIDDGLTQTAPGTHSREHVIYVSQPQSEAALLENPALWANLVDENFSQPNDAWQTGNLDDEWFSGSAQISDGKYVFSVDATHKSMVFRHPPSVKVLSGAFEVSVEAQRLQGNPQQTCYGLYYHYSFTSGNFYQFVVCDDQKFLVDVFKAGIWSTLIPWTASTAIQPQAANRLSVRVEGSRMAFFINDQQVGEIHDERLYRGYTGILLKSSQGSQARFVFDDFRLRAP